MFYEECVKTVLNAWFSGLVVIYKCDSFHSRDARIQNLLVLPYFAIALTPGISEFYFARKFPLFMIIWSKIHPVFTCRYEMACTQWKCALFSRLMDASLSNISISEVPKREQSSRPIPRWTLSGTTQICSPHGDFRSWSIRSGKIMKCSRNKRTSHQHRHPSIRLMALLNTNAHQCHTQTRSSVRCCVCCCPPSVV